MGLVLLFVLLPLLELFILLQLAEWITGWSTFALVVATGVIGAILARHQGWGVMSRIQHEMRLGQMPTTSLVDGVMIFLAGALLITPGLLTDILGFSLLFPPCRALYRRWLLKWLRRQGRWQTIEVVDGFASRPDEAADRVVDSRVVSRSVTDLPDR